MKKGEFRKLKIGDSVYFTMYHYVGEIPLIELIVEGKIENEILAKIKSSSSPYVAFNKKVLSVKHFFKYKLLFADKNKAINHALESLERNKQDLIALLD